MVVMANYVCMYVCTSFQEEPLSNIPMILVVDICLSGEFENIKKRNCEKHFLSSTVFMPWSSGCLVKYINLLHHANRKVHYFSLEFKMQTFLFFLIFYLVCINSKEFQYSSNFQLLKYL